MTDRLRSLRPFLLTSAGLGLLVAFFPWLFSASGKVFGFQASFRSLGNLAGYAIAIIGVAGLVSPRVRDWLSGLQQRLDALDKPDQRKVLWMFIALYTAGVISHKLRAHQSIGTHALDLGFFSNICWNTVNGHWFFSSLLERNFMGIHANWILWPLGYFYKLWSGAEVLLVAQALFITLTLPFLCRIIHDVLDSFTAGLLLSLMFVCSPYISHFVSNDFHPDGWQLPCLAAMLLAWRAGRSWMAVGVGLLGLLAKEDVSVVLSGFALFLILRKKYRLEGFVLLLGAVGALLFQVLVFIPQYVEGPHQSALFSRYHLLGSNFQEMALNLLTKPGVVFTVLMHEPSKYWRALCLLFPAGGLTVFSPLFLIPPAVSILPHILSQASTQLQLSDIYAIPTQPFIFVGAAYGAREILAHPNKRLALYLGAAGLVIAGLGVYMSPRYYRYEKPERIAALKEIKAMVPSDASVSAQQNLYPHFDARRYIQLFPIGNSMMGLQLHFQSNPDYVICDRVGNALPFDSPILARAIARMEADAAYEKIFEKQNLLVFRRKIKEEPRLLPVEMAHAQ